MVGRIRVAYWVALLLIALIASVSFVVIDRAIDSQFKGNTLVQLTGEQEVLSQRIVLLTNTAITDSAPYKRAQSVNQLRDDLKTFEANHQILTAKNTDAFSLSPKAKELLFSAPYDVNFFTTKLITDAREFLAKAGDPAMGGAKPLSQIAATALLSGYQALGDQFAMEADMAVRHVRDMHNRLFSLMLLVLAMEALFIFLPMIRDVDFKTNALVRARNDMAYLASRDQLTGLYNRKALAERFDKVLENARLMEQRVAVLHIDADKFKDINDVYGHAAGDAVLTELAARLRAMLRGSDVISRVGGDEFVVVLPSVGSRDDMHALTEKILTTICQPVEHEGIMLACGFSIGVAAYPEDGLSARELSINSDLALYRAKATGRSRAVLFEPEMLAERDERISNDKALLSAVRDGNLDIRYEPRIALETGTVKALATQIHKVATNGKSMTMAEIVEIAERADIAIQLADIVVEDMLESLAAWQSSGLRINRLSANISRSQLLSPELGEKLVNLCHIHNVRPATLAFDIPHRLLVTDADTETRASLAKIAKYGFKLETQVPDLSGTSVDILKSIGVDCVKLPANAAQFDASQETRSAALRAFCDVARNAGLTVVADGITDQGILDYLAKSGCVEGLGEAIAPAMDSGAMAQWLIRHRGSEKRKSSGKRSLVERTA